MCTITYRQKTVHLWKEGESQIAFAARNFRLLFGHFLLRCTALLRFQAVVTCCKSALEAIDSTLAVNMLHFTCVKRMAGVANIDIHLVRCCTGRKLVSATAGNFYIVVLGMDPVFHFSTRNFSLDNRAILIKGIFSNQLSYISDFSKASLTFFLPKLPFIQVSLDI